MAVGFRSRGEVFMVVYDTKITAMNAPGGMVNRYTRHKSESVLRAAKAFAPKRTGRLAGGIRLDVRQTSRNRVVGRVRSTAKYSVYVHEGTGPFIYPEGDFLRVPAFRGAAFKVKKPFVRGQYANPFLAEALAVGMAGSYPSPIGPVNPFV